MFITRHSCRMTFRLNRKKKKKKENLFTSVHPGVILATFSCLFFLVWTSSNQIIIILQSAWNVIGCREMGGQLKEANLIENHVPGIWCGFISFSPAYSYRSSCYNMKSNSTTRSKLIFFNRVIKKPMANWQQPRPHHNQFLL